MANIIESCRLVGQTYTQAEKSIPSTITEKYMIQVKPGTTVQVNELNESLDNYIPLTAEDSSTPYVRSRLACDQNFVCTERRFESVRIGIYEVTATYTSIQLGFESLSEWSRKSIRSSTRIVEIWVEASSYPADFNGDWPPTTTIPGTNVDIMGKPENLRVWSESFDIEVHVDRAAQFGLSGNADYYPGYWRSFLNGRNDDTFLGFLTGQVAFVGFSEALTTDPWATYILHFVADEIGHLQQRVIPNAKGTVLLSNTATWGAKTILQADAAYWYNPYYNAGLLPLNTIWDFTEIENPSPAA